MEHLYTTSSQSVDFAFVPKACDLLNLQYQRLSKWTLASRSGFATFVTYPWVARSHELRSSVHNGHRVDVYQILCHTECRVAELVAIHLVHSQNQPSQQDCAQEIQTLVRVTMRFRIRSHMPTGLSEGHVPLDTPKLHPKHAKSLHICKRCAHNALLGQTSLSRQHRPPNKLLIAQISS